MNKKIIFKQIQDALLGLAKRNLPSGFLGIFSDVKIRDCRFASPSVVKALELFAGKNYISIQKIGESKVGKRIKVGLLFKGKEWEKLEKYPLSFSEEEIQGDQ